MCTKVNLFLIALLGIGVRKNSFHHVSATSSTSATMTDALDVMRTKSLLSSAHSTAADVISRYVQLFEGKLSTVYAVAGNDDIPPCDDFGRDTLVNYAT